MTPESAINVATKRTCFPTYAAYKAAHGLQSTIDRKSKLFWLKRACFPIYAQKRACSPMYGAYKAVFLIFKKCGTKVRHHMMAMLCNSASTMGPLDFVFLFAFIWRTFLPPYAVPTSPSYASLHQALPKTVAVW